MGGIVFKKLLRVKKTVASILILVFLLSSFGDALLTRIVPTAEAAQATIDSDASTVGTSHILSGSQTVFIDDQTGYKFFVDAPGYCVYRKTTDGGQTWSATTTVDAQVDCISVQVWYDQWTPGDTGTYIHIATLDTNPDDVWYNRLDTNGDTLLLGSSPVSMTTGQGGTITAGANQISITKGTDGTIYASSIDASDSFVVECSSSCNVAGSWSETGTNPFGLTNNYAILAPLPGGDIIAIHRDVAAVAENIESKVWNNGTGSWDAASTTIDANATDNTTYDVGMAVTVSPTTGDVYLAYIARNTTLGADDQIRTARYSSGTWTSTKEVVRYSEKGITNVAIALDASNDDVYVAYSARTTPLTLATGNIYWRKSTDDMASWGYEQGPLNTSADDMYGINLNLVSDERIYATWFDDTDNDIFGETLADIFPGIHVRTTAFDEINSNDSYTQYTIDSNVSTAGTSHVLAGSQTVFTDDQTGYKFFVDAPGYCVYRKTTDGGQTWSGTTTVDAQVDCISIQVWYDQWTPGDTGDYIHIATLDTNPDDVWYNRLDTTSDTLLMGSAPVSTTNAQGGTITVGTNQISITKGTDGTIYASSIDASDSFVVECSASCNLAGSWSETGTNPFGLTNNYAILAPLPGGNIIAIHRDVGAAAENIESKVWNNGAGSWDAASTTIDSNAIDNATYDVGMAVTVSPTTGDVYLAYIADNATPGNDVLRTAVYSAGTWTPKTNVSASVVLGLTNVAIALDTSNDDVYVAYSAQATANTANTANVLWKRSTDGMTTWEYEQGPVNTSPDDIYGVDVGFVNSERLYVTWFDNTDDDIYGATLANLPSTAIATTGSQIASLYASTSNVYVGSVFSLYNTDETQAYDITGITITESGTIDGSADIANVKLFYELDTVSPYDCASVTYGGSESQFGSTDGNGFSGADGTSGFTGSTVNVDATEALCVYPVMDVLDSADSSSTIEISIANPASDVTVTSSSAGPSASQDLSGTTLVYNDTPTLVHYHWRNDDGNETTATSKTSGVEDTSLTAMRQGSTTRLRVEVSNEGSSSTPAMQYRLEYAPNPSTCEAATGWTDIGSAGGDFDMVDTLNLTDGADTTNIASGINGAVTDENATFLTPNGGVKDTVSQTGQITLSSSEFVELEYSIVASTTAVEGNTYCFRVTNQGQALSAYSVIPRANISSDVLVTIATTSQTATTTIPATDFYVGSAFVITENVSTRNVTSITISENGTVDAQTDLDNIELHYDLDTTAPYDCASDSYTGGEAQFGSTDTDGFSGPNGTSTFTGSVSISTTSTMCLYTVLDTTDTAQNDETIDIIMESPSSNLIVSGGGSVSPSITRDMNGSTTLLGAVLTQTHYHWRSDNGDETTATSLSGDAEDTAISNVAQTTPVRLRLQVSNEGTVTSLARALRLEYGAKITTCSAVTSWTDVGATGGAWEMYDSINLTDGDDSTDISILGGGVSNENSSFLSPNSAIKDTSSIIATTSITSSEYLEAEFSIEQTVDAGNDITYCFRLAASSVELNAYSKYAELTTSPERDFEIQRNSATILMGATSTTLVAGVHYITPNASTSAFIRITNIGITGAGHASGNTAAQNATNTTAYILNPSNIMTSVTIARTGVATSTRVDWEIIEFIGEPGSDNEMIVHDQTFIAYGVASTSATGSIVSGITNDDDVVVFITGQQSPDTGSANYDALPSTSAWDANNDTPYFWRGATGTDAVRVSYAVVEFKGPNWVVQRSEHTYSAAGVTETEAITALGNLTRTFIHTQKRNNRLLNGTDEFGAEVWLSSVGSVSYFLQAGATTPSGQTSVAWIIENTQTAAGAMEVTQSNGFTTGGTAPLTVSVTLPNGKVLTDLTNASIFANARSSLTTTIFPRAIAGITIASSTAFEIWRSNTGSVLTYRAEIVEWPTAGLALEQLHYQLFVDNNALKPTDPWPVGGQDLGEDTTLTATDEPLGEGERIRIRMSLQALNATWPAGTKAFKLQYAPMVSTCSAISEANWNTLGNAASSTIWRGFNATGTTDGTLLSGDPPTLGDLVLPSISDVAGTLEEENDTDANAHAVQVNETIEYDWIVEQNGANAETYYCFRMVETNGELLGNYYQHPKIRTASFTPKTQNWRWYDDENNETPVTPLAIENVAPIDIANGQAVKLRVVVKEVKNISRDDVRFKLQYSEYANFETVADVVATSTCTATSTWCYADGGGTDNSEITTGTLSDADSCVAGVGNGCGTHNESPQALSGFRHEGGDATEYEFTIQSAGPRVNLVYYFRLYDVVQGVPVSTNNSEQYPSLVTEGASLVFSVGGVASSTATEGITTDVASGTTTIPFGILPIGSDVEAVQRLRVTTNATEGYRIFMIATDDFMSGSEAIIPPITGTNASPIDWSTGCSTEATGCAGYHSGDDTLYNSNARFSAIDTYARMSTTTLDEVAYSSVPVTNEITDIVFKLKVRQSQPAGVYGTSIRYIAVPIF